MTRNQIHNRVRKHLLAQGVKSAKPGEGCRYRWVQDGKQLTCAVGCLIPDELYSEGLEGEDSSSVCGRFPELKKALLPSDMKHIDGLHFLLAIQRVHDNLNPHFWKQALQNLKHCKTGEDFQSFRPLNTEYSDMYS